MATTIFETIRRINAVMGTNFTLNKRDGSPNEDNIKIAKRLRNITDAEIRRFMKEDEGFNKEPRDRGYHALRALDRWYKEHGDESDEDGGTSHGDGGSGRGAGGNGNGKPTDGGSGSGGNGNGDGNEPNGDGSSEGNGNDGGDNGNGNEPSGGNGNGDGNSDGNGNGNGDKPSGGNSDGNGDKPSDKPEDEPKPDGKPSDDSSDKPSVPKPHNELSELGKKVNAVFDKMNEKNLRFNLYTWGEAGTGKSFTMKEVADFRNADYWETGIVSMKEELFGFRDAMGNYKMTELVKLLTYGATDGKKEAIVNFDEFDGFPNSVTLTMNNVFASRRFETPDGVFDVHPSVRFVATGNTPMTATDESGSYERENADASVKTRWLFFHTDYDPKVEKKLADKETVKFLQGLRRAKNNIGLNMLVTYREFTGLDFLGSLVDDGVFTPEQALETAVLKGLTEDDKDNLRRDAMIAKLIKDNNKWAVAL